MGKYKTWQKIKRYPASGQMFGTNDTTINVYESYDKFMHKKVVEYTPIVEEKPLPKVSFIRDEITPFGSTNVNFVNGEIEVDGTTEKTSLFTRQRGRYLPGLYGLAGIGVRFNDINVGTYDFGYGNNEGNRMGIRVVNGDMFTFIDSAGVNKVMRPRSQWLDPLDGTGTSGLNVTDFSKIILRIQIGWYGYLSIEFKLVIASREFGDQVVTIDTEGLSDTNSVSIEQPDLPIFAEADGGILYVGGRQYGVYGRYIPEYRMSVTQRITKTIPTTSFEPIMSVKVKSAQEWSAIPVLFDKLVAEVDNTCEYRLILHDEQASLLTGADFVSTAVEGIDDETAMELDVSATALAPGGYKMYATLFGGSGQGNDTEGGRTDSPDIVVPKGLILTVVAQALTADATTHTMLKMREEW